MIKVSAGHYRDSFCRVTYDVKKTSLPWAGRPTVWMFVIPKTGFEDGSWPTKAEAARRARVYIADIGGGPF